MNFEDELRSALARRNPPPDFAERVVRAARPARHGLVYRVGAWAAAAVIVIGAGLEYRQFRDARRARQQTLLALRIAGQQVAAAQKKLERIGFPRAAPAENR